MRERQSVTSLLQSPAYPPHLHSFPTRRSSDLDRHRRRVAQRAEALAEDAVADVEQEVEVALRPHPRQVPLPAGRSEEHTSELQSRFDLVCRLLLEKKKHKPRTDPSKVDLD